jgi:ubiquinone biosynthesis accessory factor UbiK
MLNKNIIDEINSKVSEILQHSPAKDIEKNVKVLLSGAFTRLDLVTRDEFDIQQEVLQRTREKLVSLEAKVAELENQLGLSESAAPAAAAKVTKQAKETKG